MPSVTHQCDSPIAGTTESLIAGTVAVILAGGLGTRITEETETKPKPMIDVGGRPLLWHVMKSISRFGINNFVICTGYKGYVIREFFANYRLHTSDVTFDLKSNEREIHTCKAEPWKVTVVDTGQFTMTGGRLKRVKQYLGDSPFLFTYGDGVADVDILELFQTHRTSNSRATVTAVRPPGRFGALEIQGSKVINFREKPEGDGNWINGGFFVLDPSVIDLIDGDATLWEQEPLTRLAKEDDLTVYYHHGIWQPVDTMRDKLQLEEIWEHHKLPWTLEAS